MIVVSDTTPIISLMKIGKLGLIQELFETVDESNGVLIDEESDIRSVVHLTMKK